MYFRFIGYGVIARNNPSDILIVKGIEYIVVLDVLATTANYLDGTPEEDERPRSSDGPTDLHRLADLMRWPGIEGSCFNRPDIATSHRSKNSPDVTWMSGFHY
ncbi:hypothetical protein J6590_031367 [Homalodisca vitripennis]|nr:hypothetical protein J6590_031367 [Homalodisca vitripennis]